LNLKIFPQTALLLLLDALRSSGEAYQLALYVDSDSLGGALFELTPDLTQGQLLFAENDLQTLVNRFLQGVGGGGAVQPEPVVDPHPAGGVK